MKHLLAKIAEIPTDGTKVVDFFGREIHLYLLNGAPKAVVSICTHFGGPLECKDGRLVCAWHGARFALDGLAETSPAPKGSKLMFLSTRIEDDALYYVWGE